MAPLPGARMSQPAQNCSNKRGPADHAGKAQRGRARAGRGGRGGQGDGRESQTTFPWINGQIIAAAETGDLHRLLTTIEAHVHQMNLVNLSTALHRLAKLASAAGVKPTSRSLWEQTLPSLLDAVRKALIKCEANGSVPKCQAITNITWALATTQAVDVPLLRMLLEYARNQLDDFKGFELCQLLWASAKLGTMSQAVCGGVAALFNPAAQWIVAHMDELSCRGLVMAAWAFATAKQHDASLFHAIASRLAPAVDAANCQELANTAWSFSTAGVYEERLFAKIADVSIPRVHDFKPQELSSIAWSFASIGCMNDEFYETVGFAATQTKLQEQQLANILWALTKMRPRHESTKEVILSLLPQCSRLVESFKTQELATVALAVSKCFGANPEIEQTHASFPSDVLSFFIAAFPVVVPNLTRYSGQSLANITSSFLALRIDGASDLYATVSSEVVGRVNILENSAMLLLLKNLPYAPQSPLLCSAVSALFAEAAKRAATMQNRELQILARLCARPFSGRVKKSLTEQVAWDSTGDIVARCDALAVAWREQLGAAEDHRLEQDPDAAFDRWAASMTLTAASAGRPLSVWDAEATDQLRQDMEMSASLREGAAGGRGNLASSERLVALSAGAATQQPQVAVNVSVRNTFIDMVEDCDLEVLEVPLPPALECIPASVSLEKLQAFRHHYARFRVGNGVGAKGEVAEQVARDDTGEPVAQSCAPAAAQRQETGAADATDAGRGVGTVPDRWQAPITLTVASAGRPPSAWDAEAMNQLRQDIEKFASLREDVARERGTLDGSAKLDALNENAAAQQPQVVVNVSVKNTFIDMVDGCDLDELDVPLPPALDCIPHSVCPEKLQAFRHDYARFRVGNCVGAKGEVDAVA